jgi:AraC-like DNA-binding protein
LYSLLEQTTCAPAVFDLLAQSALYSTWAWFMYLRLNPPEETEMSGKELALAEKARDFLDALPDRMEYTIITLAKELGTNETTLKTAFKKLTGTTIHKYYHAKRMEKAEGFLKAGKSITETSKLIGYKHVSHFSHIYKQQYGVSPGKIYG